jgi:hypothetical protein
MEESTRGQGSTFNYNSKSHRITNIVEKTSASILGRFEHSVPTYTTVGKKFFRFFTYDCSRCFPRLSELSWDILSLWLTTINWLSITMPTTSSSQPQDGSDSNKEDQWNFSVLLFLIVTIPMWRGMHHDWDQCDRKNSALPTKTENPYCVTPINVCRESFMQSTKLVLSTRH